jgi:hypothetical protein
MANSRASKNIIYSKGKSSGRMPMTDTEMSEDKDKMSKQNTKGISSVKKVVSGKKGVLKKKK